MLVSLALSLSQGLVLDSGALTGVRDVFMFGSLILDVRVSGDEDPGTSVFRSFFLVSMVCRRRVSFKATMAVYQGNLQKGLI